MEPLSHEEITAALPELDVAWSAIPGEGLVRVWEVKDFNEGFGLAGRLAGVITAYQSAPTLLVTHDKVQLVLSAAAAPGVTAREIALAEAIDNLLD